MSQGSRQSRRELAGLGLIIGIITLCGLIFFLDTIRHALQNNFNIVAIFKEAPRLRTGSVVWVAGQPMGHVIAVELLPPSRDTLAPRVSALLEIKTSAKPTIRRDSKIQLAAPRLMAEPVVGIDAGSADAPMIREGDTLRSIIQPPRTAALIADATQTKASLDSLLIESKGLRARLGTRTAQMSRLRREASLASNELAKLQNDMQNGPLTKMMDDQERSSAIARIQANASAITDAVTQAQERAAKASRDAEPARQKLIRHIAELQLQLNTLQKMMDNPNGVYGRMQKDSALIKAVHGAQSQLDSLIVESKKSPTRYWF